MFVSFYKISAPFFIPPHFYQKLASKIPNFKSQIPKKFQFSISKHFLFSSFENWDLVLIWNLNIDICDFRH